MSVGAQSSPYGYTALQLAYLSGHVGVVELLLAIPLILCSSVTLDGSVCRGSVLAIWLHSATPGLPLVPCGHGRAHAQPFPLILCSSITIGGSVCEGSVFAIWLHGAAPGLLLGPRHHGGTHASHSPLPCVLLSL